MENKGIISAFLEENYKHFNAAALMDASKAYIAHLNAGGKMMVFKNFELKTLNK